MQPDFPAQESQNAQGFQRFLCALSGRLFFGTYAMDFTAVGNDVAQTAVNPTKAGYAAKAGLLIANAASVVPGTTHTVCVAPLEGSSPCSAQSG